MRDHSTQPPVGGERECHDCPAASASRRAFLRDVALGVASLLALDAATSPALALVNSVREIRADAAGGVGVYSVPAGDSVSIDVQNEVILARWQNRVYAFSLKCPHRGTRLEWLADEQRVFCPKHKARFSADGQHESGRGSRNLDRYAISRRGSSVAVSLDVLYRADEDPDAWGRAVLTLA